MSRSEAVSKGNRTRAANRRARVMETKRQLDREANRRWLMVAVPMCLCAAMVTAGAVFVAFGLGDAAAMALMAALAFSIAAMAAR